MNKPCAIDFFAALAAVLSLCGCSTNSNQLQSLSANTARTFSGRAIGGQQPISGASITLWQVNTNGSAATSMLVNPVTTDANGYFNITSDYPNSNTACTASTQVYLLATGGNPGLGAGTNNTAIALMAPLGSCTALQSMPFIVVNEATTVAGVWALHQFLGVSEGTPGADDIATGTNSQSATGMINAFAIVPALVNPATGTTNNTYGNATIPAAKIRSLANVLAACVNTTGASSTACQSLFSAVTPPGALTPGDTIQAALYMAQNPSLNVNTTFNLQTPDAPFQPSLATAPFDWSLALTYTGGGLNLPNLLAADANGNVWVADSAGSNAQALVEFGPAGSVLGTFLSGSRVAFDGPQAVVPDTLGSIWISAHGSSGSTGNRLVAYNPTTNTATAHPATSGCFPYAAAIDGADNVFFACSALGYAYEFPNQTTGTPSSTNLPSYSVSPVQLGPIGTQSYGMALDALNNLWVANTQTSGSPTVTEYNAGSYTTAANTYTFGSGPVGIAADHSNNVWAVTANYLNEFVYNGTPGSYTATAFTGGGLNSGRYLSVDGAGNIWVANGSTSTIGGVTYATVSEFNNNGLPLTTDVTTTQPGGLALPVTATSPAPRGLTIDPSGNVWVAGCGLSTSCSGGTSFLMEFLGVASPPVTPLATAIAKNQLGCCSFTPAPLTGTTPTQTAGNVTLQASSVALTQNAGQFAFEVTRSGGFQGAISVSYTTLNGTATAGTDYTATSGTLSWADSDNSVKTITVPWLRTTNYAGTKTFSVNLSCSSACPAAFTPNQTELVTVTDNLTPPSTQFAFSGSTESFSLNLPVDIYGGTGGTGGAQFASQNISASTLAAGFSDPYFYLNASNQIVFTAPSNGATTSPGVGSNDTRSELRELYTGPGSSTGSDWDSTIGGTMTATVAVNATPVNTDEVTIGQIHGQTQPFALLEYKPTSSTQGNIVLAYNLTNTSNSGSASQTVAAGVNLNSFVTYTLKFSGSTLSATVSGNTVTINNIDSSWQGAGVGQYFKIGTYSGAGNTGNPAGDKSQVTVSAFSITHP